MLAVGPVVFAQNSANLRLSQSRTVAVIDYLVSARQIATTHASNNTEQGRLRLLCVKKTARQKAG